jgi:hypothetical protein
MASMINFYDQLPKGLSNGIQKDKAFKTHLVEPTSNILIIGQTGAGKTNSLLNFLSLKNDSFAEIIIFTGSTCDEPLYNYLKKENPDVQMIDDIAQLPELSDFNETDKKLERLIVFDDVANICKKDETKLKNWVKACRKYGFTACFLYQSYVVCPKFIRDNCQLFWIFKLQSSISLSHILKDKSSLQITKEELVRMYDYATRNKGDFFNIDTKSPDMPFRRNFTEILRTNPK